MDHAEDGVAPGRRFGRFSLATMLVAMTAIAIAVAIWNESRKQDVTAYVLIKRSPAPLTSRAAEAGAMSEDEYRQFRDTQVALMRSKSLLVRALRSPSVYNLPMIRNNSDPVGWLEKELKFDFPGDAELLRIRLSSRDIDEAAKIVNVVVDTYFKECVEREIVDRLRAEQKLEQIYHQLDEQYIRERRETENLLVNLKGEHTPEVEARERRAEVLAEELKEIQRKLIGFTIRKQEPFRVQRVDEAMTGNIR